MFRRRQSYAKRRLRLEFHRFLRVMRKDLVQLTVGITIVCAVEVALPSPGWLKGLMVGFLVTAAFATVGFAFLLHGDSAFLVAGSLGESYTAAELEAARKAGLIWSWIPNIEASNRDVDHLILAPSGVLAAETKWRFRDANPAWLRDATERAERSARQGRLVLQSKGIDHRAAVKPVVIVWGGARRELPAHQVINEVDVVRGDHLLAWLEQCSRGHLAEDHAEQLHGKVLAFTATRTSPDIRS